MIDFESLRYLPVEERAVELRGRRICNCCQAVTAALTEDPQLILASAGFGGGMARQREVCGAVSGMILVLNCKYGNTDMGDKAAKDAHYARVQALCDRFRQETGSIVCRELLGLAKDQKDTPQSEARTAEYYKKRPCAKLVALAASLTEEALSGI